MKKQGIVGMLVLLFGILLFGNSMEVEAEEYAWASTSGGDACWYQANYAKEGYEMEGTPATITDEDVIVIQAEPDEACAEFLRGLTGTLGTIRLEADVEVEIGTPGGGLEFIMVNISQGTATVYADTMGGTVYNGNLNVYGDVSWLSIGSPNTGKIGQGNVQISGNAGSLDWYKQNDRDIVYNYYIGNVTVNGTVDGGSIMEYIYDETIQKDVFQKTGSIGKCEAGIFKIQEGVLSSQVSVTEVIPNLGDYYFEYGCDNYGSDEAGNPANSWYKAFYSNSTGEYAGSEPCNETDVPEGAIVRVFSTAQPVEIPFDLEELYVVQGDVAVEGNVDTLTMWTQRKGAYDVKVSGDVEYFDMTYKYNPEGNLYVGGTVVSSDIWDASAMQLRCFTCNNMQILQNGEWNPNLFFSAPQGENIVEYQPVTEDVLQDALGEYGIGSEVTVGEQTLVKSAATTINQVGSALVENFGQNAGFTATLDKIVEEIKATEGKDMQAKAICAIDILLNSMYVDKSTGEVYSKDAAYGSEPITELPSGKTLEFSVKVPKEFYKEGSLYSIIRSHINASGVEEWAALATTQVGDVLTFESDKFSTFVIVESTLEQNETILPGDSEKPTEENEPQPQAPAQQQTTSTSQASSNANATDTKEVKPLTYTVVSGDTLSKIAARHGLKLRDILALNPQIKNPNRIYPGQVLIVGAGTDETDNHTFEYVNVQKGDSLYKIARKNNLSLQELYKMNHALFAQKYIYAGQRVRIK